MDMQNAINLKTYKMYIVIIYYAHFIC